MWHRFPDTAPHTGAPILIGGWSLPIADQTDKLPILIPDRWVVVVAQYDRFHNQPYYICTNAADTTYKWVTQGFQTLSNYNVRWEYWSEIKLPPARLEE